MRKKPFNEKTSSREKFLKPSRVQDAGSEPAGLQDGNMAESAPPSADAFLMRVFQQAQQVDSALWEQEHRGNLATRDMLAVNGSEKASPVSDLVPGLSGDAGEPLEAQIQTEMESTLNHSFDNVRIHNGASSNAAAEQLGARAFTINKDIYFRRGEYDTATDQGKRLLGHELVHVAQQDNVIPRTPSSVASPGSAAEIEAEAAAGNLGWDSNLDIAPRPEVGNLIACDMEETSTSKESARTSPSPLPLARRRSLYYEFSRNMERIRIPYDPPYDFQEIRDGLIAAQTYLRNMSSDEWMTFQQNRQFRNSYINLLQLIDDALTLTAGGHTEEAMAQGMSSLVTRINMYVWNMQAVIYPEAGEEGQPASY